jgi:glutamate N-acetyltransferase/amino-acid N-acetyltransferase
MDEIEGGVTAPQGFIANGVRCGIKRATTGPSGGKDLALVATDHPCPAVGVFTTNKAAAVCVEVCKANLANETACAIIANSGNANCCTGERGRRDALQLVETTARQLGCRPVDVLQASTGPIGRYLPLDKVLEAVPALVEGASVSGARAAAEAILTTDTRTKEFACRFDIEGRAVTIGAMAKGAGMIEPDMRTMLAFITTDAVIDRQFLLLSLREAVASTFNRITVDGDRSTNDMVLALANGRAGNDEINDAFGAAPFQAALAAVCGALAKMIVKDGEGATKFVEVIVRGAATNDEAEAAARAIANSNLFKCAMYGASANWGRVMAALGSTDVTFDVENVEIAFGDVVVVRAGAPADHDAAHLAEVMAADEIRLTVSLGQGTGRGVIWTCDFSPEYVNINV